MSEAHFITTEIRDYKPIMARNGLLVDIET